MKKIIGIMVISLLSNQLIAQTSAPTSGAKMLSTAESKKQNSNTETTINGIPYSQYKAQQDALKQKQASENKAPVTSSRLVSTTATKDDIVPAANQKQPATKQGGGK